MNIRGAKVAVIGATTTIAWAQSPSVAVVPMAARLARGVLGLPIHPYLDNPTQDRIIAVLREACGP